MSNEIISYFEMCQREGTSLQKGMNFGIGHNYSVILVSFRPNAPYRDRQEEDGMTLIYEGHDVAKSSLNTNPKTLDQPQFNPTGSLTENGKFHNAAQEYKKGDRTPEIVKVYEKIRPGIWSYNGLFVLVDSWQENDSFRSVFKFKLNTYDSEEIAYNKPIKSIERRRVIPTWVKREVWKRDGGKCVICGATDELHFDHILPFSKGGTSITPENVQLLCARHNIQKSNKIL